MKTETCLTTEFSQLDQANKIASKKTICTLYSIFYDGKLITRVKSEKIKNWFINLFLVSYEGANISRLHVIERSYKK